MKFSPFSWLTQHQCLIILSLDKFFSFIKISANPTDLANPANVLENYGFLIENDVGPNVNPDDVPDDDPDVDPGIEQFINFGDMGFEKKKK